MSGAADEFNEFGVLLPTSNAIPLRYRDAELESLLRRLQSNRPSAIVVGPSGSGKTALIEAAATRLDRRFVEVNCGQMLVGTRYLGEAETRYKHLIDLCVGKKYIAYFTDIWLLYQTGRTSGHDNSLGTFLAPYVSRGDLVLVGECTDEQFHSAADDNRAFAATFGTVRISELTDAECNEILSSRLAALSEPRDSSERQAGGAAINVRGPVDIQIDELARRRVIEESKMAFPSIAAPGRVVRLLDAVISDEVESSVASNEEGKPLVVRQEKVIRVVEKLTGMSLRLLDEAEPLKADDVRNWLETRVLGQPEAIKAVVDVVMLVKSGMNRPDRPIAVMMFVGPTGVGKTELARRLAEYVFGSDSRLIRFDMAEFQDFSAVQRLAGSPFASDPAARDGLLNSKVRNQPFCVVLFDEIEKAHRAVHHMLLGVFGSGRLADPQGRTTDFTRCIMVMTSNLGSDISNVGGFGFKPSGLNLDSAVNDAMASFFSPEFRGRITRQVLFQPLGIAQFRTLAQREVGRILLQRGIRR
jgi:ATP-dependent Clp protease ATP-binding subunit ClpC